jgi:hypothetical protein
LTEKTIMASKTASAKSSSANLLNTEVGKIAQLLQTQPNLGDSSRLVKAGKRVKAFFVPFIDRKDNNGEQNSQCEKQ